MEEYIIAREKHEDGKFHLHCWFKLKKTLNLKRSDKFDFKDEDGAVYHPNIQAAKCNAHVIKYVTKDGHFISSKPKEELLLQVAARKKHSTVVGEKILAEGKLTAAIIEEHPQLLVQGNLARVKQNLQIYKQLQEEEKMEQIPAGTYFGEFDPTVKCRHKWIYGPPNTGKSTMLGEIMRTCRAYLGPYNNDWTGFNPDYHDVIVFDEYHG